MYTTINTDQLLKKLGVSGESQHQTCHLTCTAVCFIKAEANQVLLQATNLEIGIEAQCEASTEEEVVAVLSSNAFRPFRM